MNTLRNFKKLSLTAICAVLVYTSGMAQLIGDRGNSQPAPSAVKNFTFDKHSLGQDNVNLFDGTLDVSYPLGSVSTPSGLSYAVQMSYSSTYSTGNVSPHLDGLPFGQGWNVAIPQITVVTEAANKTVVPNILGNTYVDYNLNELKNEGKQYYYNIRLSIPGVANGNLIYKMNAGARYANAETFVLDKFESHVEARFDGSEWVVTTDDGTEYTFSYRQLSYTNSANTHVNLLGLPDISNTINTANYNHYFLLDNNTNTNPNASVSTQHRAVLENLIVPKNNVMGWYISKIRNPNQYLTQAIVFQYLTFGKSFYYPEMVQTGVRQAVNAILYPNFTSNTGASDPRNNTAADTALGPWAIRDYTIDRPLPRLLIYKDILLKEVIAIDIDTEYEKIVLEYDNINLDQYYYNAHYRDPALFNAPKNADGIREYDPASGLYFAPTEANLLLLSDTAVKHYDNMYCYKKLNKIGVRYNNNFVNWKRYRHLMSLRSDGTNGYYPKISADDVSMFNPYVAKGGYRTNDKNYFFGEENVNSRLSIPFDHSFLESPRIGQDFVPGDEYEVNTTILFNYGNGELHRRACNFDINLATGPTNASGLGYITNQTQYGTGTDFPLGNYQVADNISKAENVFTTFNQAIKWNWAYQYTNDMITTNRFSMPNLPNNYEGFNIQIGPANSDNVFNFSPSQITTLSIGTLLDASQNFYEATAYDTYFFTLKKNHNGFFNSNYNTMLSPYETYNNIPSNFGIGLPWHQVLPINRYSFDKVCGFDHNLHQSYNPNSAFNERNSLLYRFWFNDNNNFETLPLAEDWKNRPTAAGEETYLSELEIRRYSKKPYVLKGVKVYRLNGVRDPNLNKFTTKKDDFYLVNAYELLYDIVQVRVLNNKLYGASETPQLKANNGRDYFKNIVLLSYINQLPVNPTQNPDVSTATKPIYTFFKYKNVYNDVNYTGDILKQIYYTPVLLSYIKDEKGKETYYEYDTDPTINILMISPYSGAAKSKLQNPSNYTYDVMSSSKSVAVSYKVLQKKVGGPNGTYRIWDYEYGNPVSVKNGYSSNKYAAGGWGNVAESRTAVQNGFETVTLREPILAGINGRAYSVYEHYTDYDRFGKPKKISEYNTDGRLVKTTESQYSIIEAYKHFYKRNRITFTNSEMFYNPYSYGGEINYTPSYENIFGEYFDWFSVSNSNYDLTNLITYTPIATNYAGHLSVSVYKDKVSFYETSGAFLNTDNRYHRSIFVKKVRDTETEYEYEQVQQGSVITDINSRLIVDDGGSTNSGQRTTSASGWKSEYNEKIDSLNQVENDTFLITGSTTGPSYGYVRIGGTQGTTWRVSYLSNITEYEYFDADYRGKTRSRGYKKLLYPDHEIIHDRVEIGLANWIAYSRVRGIEKLFVNLESAAMRDSYITTNRTAQQLYDSDLEIYENVSYDPSWQLYKIKTSSPQLPDAYREEESFYYFDLRKDYRYMFGHDQTPASTYYDADDITSGTLDERFKQLFVFYDKKYRDVPFQKTLTIKEPGKAAFKTSQFFTYQTDWEFDSPTWSQKDTVYPQQDMWGYCDYLQNVVNATTTTTTTTTTTNQGGGGGFTNGTVPCFDTEYVNPDPVIAEENGVEIIIKNLNTSIYSNQRNLPDTLAVMVDSSGTEIMNVPPCDNSVSPEMYNLNMSNGQVWLSGILTQSSAEQYNSQDNGVLRFHRITDAATNLDIYTFDVTLDVLAHKIHERNVYGQVVLEEDASGLKTKYYYSKREHLFYNDAVNVRTINIPGGGSYVNECNSYSYFKVYNPAKILAITSGYDTPDSLITKYSYHTDLTLKSVTDPAGTVSQYSFDEFGRAKELLRNGQVLNEYSYTYAEPNTTTFEGRATQNTILSISYLNGRKGLMQKAFFDPLGRKHASTEMGLDLDNQPDEVVHGGQTLYDEWDRVVKNYKPFAVTGGDMNTPLYNLIYRSAPQEYSQAFYENDSRSRTTETVAFGETAGVHSRKKTYRILSGSRLATELSLSTTDISYLFGQFTADKYSFRENTLTDEDGKITHSYTDAAGKTVATKAMDNTTRVITLYTYNYQGMMNKVINPEKLQTNYFYNHLGRLYRKQSPENDVMYMYDISGNLITEQDNELRSQNRYRTYSYDVHDRMLLQQQIEVKATALTQMPFKTAPAHEDQNGSGWFDIPQNQLNALNLYANQQKLYPEKELYYDVSVYGSTGMGEGISTDADFGYTKGKVTAIFTYDELNNQLPHSMQFMGYNADGNLNKEIKLFNPNGIDVGLSGISVSMKYRYNLQNMPVSMEADVNDNGSNDIVYRYEYDHRGRIAQVHASQLNPALTLTDKTKIVEYLYDNATGLLKQTLQTAPYNNCEMLPSATVNYTYDIRNRLTHLQSEHFEQTLYYGANLPATGLNSQQWTASNNFNGNINASEYSYYTGAFVNASLAAPVFAGKTYYGYTYDGLNRLTLADAYLPQYGNNLIKVGDEQLSYDKAGNILNLKRWDTKLQGGNPVLRKNEWNYVYLTNANSKTNKLGQMTGVGGSATRTFGYTPNGSVNADSRNGLGYVLYGYGQLPIEMAMASEGILTNIVRMKYNAGGQRIFKAEIPQTTDFPLTRIVKSTDYYLHDAQGREIGLLDMEKGEWKWYVQGIRREAMIKPETAQQPEYITERIGNAAMIAQSGNPDDMAVQQALQDAKDRGYNLPDKLLEIQHNNGQREIIMLKVLNERGNNNDASIVHELPLTAQTNMLELPGTKKLIHVSEVTLPTPRDTTNTDTTNVPDIVVPNNTSEQAVLKHVTYYLADHLGSTRMVYTPVATCNGSTTTFQMMLEAAMDYYPYGKVLRQYQLTPEKYLFTGKERDSETGYDYFGARGYDSEVGRFFSIDPKTGMYPTLSPYHYTANNPILFIDADGADFYAYTAALQNQVLGYLNQTFGANHGFAFNAEGKLTVSKNFWSSNSNQMIIYDYFRYKVVEDPTTKAYFKGLDLTGQDSHSDEYGGGSFDIYLGGTPNAALRGDRIDGNKVKMRAVLHFWHEVGHPIASSVYGHTKNDDATRIAKGKFTVGFENIAREFLFPQFLLREGQNHEMKNSNGDPIPNSKGTLDIKNPENVPENGIAPRGPSKYNQYNGAKPK